MQIPDLADLQMGHGFVTGGWECGLQGNSITTLEQSDQAKGQ